MKQNTLDPYALVMINIAVENMYRITHRPSVCMEVNPSLYITLHSFPALKHSQIIGVGSILRDEIDHGLCLCCVNG